MYKFEVKVHIEGNNYYEKNRNTIQLLPENVDGFRHLTKNISAGFLLHCVIFSMSFPWQNWFFSMTKFRHIPGIKLLKNVSSSITSHRLNKNVHHNIFFIDEYFSHEFSMSFGIFLKFHEFSKTGK